MPTRKEGASKAACAGRAAALLAGLLVSGIASDAVAASRWAAVSGPGFLNAGVENQEGARFEVSCPFGQGDRTPLVFVDGPKFRLPPGGRPTARIVIDGNSHALGFQGGVFRAEGRGARADLEGLLKAMIVSKAKAFTVEFPELNRRISFSLLGATQAIDGPYGWMLDRCPAS